MKMSKRSGAAPSILALALAACVSFGADMPRKTAATAYLDTDAHGERLNEISQAMIAGHSVA